MPPEVAQDIVAYCTSCRMDLTHTVVSVHADKAKRVLCQTCKKEHAFRRPAKLMALSAKKRTAKSEAPLKAKWAVDEWLKDMERMRDLSAKVYTLDGLYEAGEKLDHRTFGLGTVKNLIAPNKMEVLFEEGMKLLVREFAQKASG